MSHCCGRSRHACSRCRMAIERPARPPAAPKPLFNGIIRLIGEGELGTAEARCRAALARYPRDVNMMGLLGALLVKMNRREEAEAKLREVIPFAPLFEKPKKVSDYLRLQLVCTPEELLILERAVSLAPLPA